MRIKLISSVGSAALILSGSVFAASPANFGNTVRDGITGVITGGTSCTGVGVTCSAPVSDADFFQQQVDVGGAVYFHTVINDGAGFSDENWVKAGAAGIRDMQSVAETNIGGVVGDNFSSGTELNIGWGETDTAGLARVHLTQTQATGAANFDSNFDFKDGLGGVAGTSLTIVQHTSTGVGTHQSFAQMERSGAYQTAVTSLDMTGRTIDVGEVGATAMNIAAGDLIASTYIGQTIDLGASLGGINSFGWGFLRNESAIDATGAAILGKGVAAAELGLSFTSTANPAAPDIAATTVGGATYNSIFTAPVAF